MVMVVAPPWALAPRQKRWDGREAPRGVNVLSGTPLEWLLCNHLTRRQRDGGMRPCGHAIGFAQYGASGRVFAVWFVPGLHKLRSKRGEPDMWAWSNRAARSPRHVQRSPNPIMAYVGINSGDGSGEILGHRRFIDNPSPLMSHWETPDPGHHPLHVVGPDGERLWSSHRPVWHAKLPIRVRCICTHETWIDPMLMRQPNN